MALTEQEVRSQFGDGDVFIVRTVGGVFLSSGPEFISGCHAGKDAVTFFAENADRFRVIREIRRSEILPPGATLEDPGVRIRLNYGGMLTLDFRKSLDFEKPAEHALDFYQHFWAGAKLPV